MMSKYYNSTRTYGLSQLSSAATEIMASPEPEEYLDDTLPALSSF